ncbi:DUF2513 domain-containing protein [Enterococcus faecalis]|uniref:DUF2513 domain-containing protein n=1 Tax=Enterococcus faecalis TaxID=1351 RepID=UPI00177B87D0|nr:DUF2513 domain-containing protein [Enterococcus faecalis]MBD9846446.1 DUF2513 domain-containing protein [Enterococcus faecalis]
MKLNPDCVRDLLLEIEQTTDSNKMYSYSSQDKYLKKYDENVVYYHFRQADLSGLLYQSQFDMAGNFGCVDLSPKGHQFLNDIRSENNWKKTKEIASTIGSFSLDALSNIASGVITNLINGNLNP